MPVDKFRMAKKCLEVIDQALGRKKGTTAVGSLEEEEITALAGRFARTITVLQWGIVGCLGLLVSEHDKKTTRDARSVLPFWNFEWNHYHALQHSFEAMLAAGAEPDMLVQPEVMHEVFKITGKRANLPDMQKRAVWDICRKSKWHSLKAKQMMEALMEAMLQPADRQQELLKVLADAVQMMEATDGIIDDQDATGTDVSRE